MEIQIFLVISMFSAGVMIAYEFIVGFFTKFVLKKEAAWIYMRFKDHKYRSISAFSPQYFLAWFILGLIHTFLIQEFFR